jgi:hypothetical protein
MTTTAEWEYLMSAMVCPNAIDASIGSAMAPSLDTGGRNIVIADGVAAIKGQLWRCDAPISTSIPAASAQNRIDRLVLRLNRGATSASQVVQPVVITGTPSGSPIIPPITQTPTGIWDLPVCHWTSTSAGALTSLSDERRLANDNWHDMRPLTGSFIGSVSGYPPPQYRFSDDIKWVEFGGFLQTPPSTGNYNGTIFAALPANYRPISSNGTEFLVNSVADGAATPIFRLWSTGNCTLHFLPNSLAQTIIGITGRILLEDSNGFVQT